MNTPFNLPNIQHTPHHLPSHNISTTFITNTFLHHFTRPLPHLLPPGHPLTPITPPSTSTCSTTLHHNPSLPSENSITTALNLSHPTPRHHHNSPYSLPSKAVYASRQLHNSAHRTRRWRLRRLRLWLETSEL